MEREFNYHTAPEQLALIRSHMHEGAYSPGKRFRSRPLKHADGRYSGIWTLVPYIYRFDRPSTLRDIGPILTMVQGRFDSADNDGEIGVNYVEDEHDDYDWHYVSLARYARLAKPLVIPRTTAPLTTSRVLSFDPGGKRARVASARRRITL